MAEKYKYKPEQLNKAVLYADKESIWPQNGRMSTDAYAFRCAATRGKVVDKDSINRDLMIYRSLLRKVAKISQEEIDEKLARIEDTMYIGTAAERKRIMDIVHNAIEGLSSVSDFKPLPIETVEDIFIEEDEEVII